MKELCAGLKGRQYEDTNVQILNLQMANSFYIYNS